MPKWAVPIWDLEKTSPPITRVFCVSPQFFAPYLWNDLGSNIRVSFFIWCGKSITRAKLKMEIPASKGMRDKKYNQLIRWTTTGFAISNCFWGFCPFVLPKISTHLSSKVWFGLEKRSFAEFWIWTFFASSCLKTKRGFWAFTTNRNHLSCTSKNNFPVLQCASVFWVRSHWPPRISLFDSTEKLIQRITEFMRSVLLCLSTIESEDCSNSRFFFRCFPQPMVNCWFGARWFGILRVPLRIPIPFIFGDPIGIQTTGPQTNKNTISWFPWIPKRQKVGACWWWWLDMTQPNPMDWRR